MFHILGTEEQDTAKWRDGETAQGRVGLSKGQSNHGNIKEGTNNTKVDGHTEVQTGHKTVEEITKKGRIRMKFSWTKRGWKTTDVGLSKPPVLAGGGKGITQVPRQASRSTATGLGMWITEREVQGVFQA